MRKGPVPTPSSPMVSSGAAGMIMSWYSPRMNGNSLLGLSRCMRNLCVPVFSTLTICRAKDVRARWKAKDEITSSAVMSRPLWNTTPSRSAMSHDLRSPAGAQEVASSGSTCSRSFT